jgi:hypothetical protein
MNCTGVKNSTIKHKGIGNCQANLDTVTRRLIGNKKTVWKKEVFTYGFASYQETVIYSHIHLTF